jgi:hypothetical protein
MTLTWGCLTALLQGQGNICGSLPANGVEPGALGLAVRKQDVVL